MKLHEIMEGLGAGKAFTAKGEEGMWYVKMGSNNREPGYEYECLRIYWLDDGDNERWEIEPIDFEVEWVEHIL